MASATEDDRAKRMIHPDKMTKEQVLRQEPLTLFEEIVCVLFLAFGVPNCVFNIPPVLFFVGYFIVGNVFKTFLYFGLFVLLPLAIIPQPFCPSTLDSWLARTVCKYFSFTMITEGVHKSRINIIVAPPHGVFPYGNIMAVLTWPVLHGCYLRSIASSAALRAPIIKQIMKSIGAEDAYRTVARKLLDDGNQLGISTGGVAEVFETNAQDECIVLKERVGLIKLAIRTGADLVPCYVFGNTKIMGCWAGEGVFPGLRSILEPISRKLGLATVVIIGRFGLPIPRRVPIFAVGGTPIPTKHIQCEDPSPELVKETQDKLLKAMEEVFEKYKGLYGWKDKRLIIK